MSGNDFVTMSESSKRGYITGYLDGYSVPGQMKKNSEYPIQSNLCATVRRDYKILK